MARGARGARVVVVGAGLMGRWHAHAAARVGAEVVGVTDVDAGAAARLASAHGGTAVFPDLEQALSAGHVDVVHVCTPASSHAPLVDLALAAGCHVLVEKPTCSSLSETERLLERARALGLALNPVHQLPFQRGFVSVLKRRNRLGDLVRVTYRTCSAGGTGRSADERRAILVEILPHPVSLFARLFPDEFDERVLEVTRFTEDDLDLAGSLGDVRLDVSISLRGRPVHNELHLVGTDASAHVDLFHGFALLEESAVSRSAKALRPFRLGGALVARAGGNLALRGIRREPAYPGLRELIRLFHAVPTEGAAPPIADSETIRAAQLIERVRLAS